MPDIISEIIEQIDTTVSKILEAIDKSITPIKMENFHQIDRCLFRGSTPNHEDLKLLAQKGIGTVINFKYLNKKELKEIQEYAKTLGINYINIPMINPLIPYRNIDIEDIELFLSIVRYNKKPVFICCSQGRDRTGMMAAIYRIIMHRWSFEKAFKEMQEKGHHSKLCFKLKNFLQKFAATQVKNSVSI